MTGRSASSLLYSWKGVLCACLPGSKTSKGKEMSRQTATALPTGVIRQPRRLLKDIGPYADCLYVTNLTMNVYGVCVTKERERQKRVRFVFWSLTGTWLNTSNVFRGIH
ncbi:E3 ubiquitin-protein ligase SIAH1 isoform X5 [Aptenodytes patagonicus]|uniref:E3 ubiquitin-protein ligase SIAH1 isoform X5 n=1 Tax=Aptenodytes patagonicus TaxID=9234 RepID=UPI003FA076A4